MCLYKLNDAVTKSEGIGYKIFEVSPNGRIQAFIFKNRIAEYIPGILYTNKDKPLLFDIHEKEYEAGYHIFNSPEDCKKYLNGVMIEGEAIYKVEYEEVNAEGYQKSYRESHYIPCIVAQKMKLIEEVGV